MSPSSQSAPLSPAERRQRNRQETTDAILAVARAVIQEHGVAALNLNEVARQVKMRPQSLAAYFPNKAAVYDALIEQSLAMICEVDELAYRDHPPGWAQIEAWFANRIALMIANPDLYHLTFDAPVPDYAFPDRLLDVTRNILAQSRQMVADAVATGAIEPGIPVEQATDLLITLRRGLVAEQIGKRRYLAPRSGRYFDELLGPLLDILKTAWTPASASDAPTRATVHRKGVPMPD